MWERLRVVGQQAPKSSDLKKTYVRLTAQGALAIRDAKNSPTASRDIHRLVLYNLGNIGSPDAIAQNGSPGAVAQNASPQANVVSSTYIERYANVVDQFAEALIKAGDDLDANAQKDARHVLKRARNELGDEATPTTVSRTVQWMREIALGAAGSAAWAGVLLAIDRLLPLLGQLPV